MDTNAGETSRPAARRPLEALGQHAKNPVHSLRDDLADQYTAFADDDTLAEQQREAALLFSVAEGALNEEDVERTMKAATDALALFHLMNDQVGKADVLRIMIDAYRLQSIEAYDLSFESAIHLATEELRKFQEARDKRGEAMMKLSLGEIYTVDMATSSNHENAIETVSEALELFQELGDKKMEGNGLIALSHVQWFKGLPKKVRDSASRALECFQEVGDRKGEARAMHALALSYTESEDFDSAIRKAKEALNLYRQLEDKRGEAFELMCCAMWSLEAEKPQKALPLAQEAMTLFRDVRHGKGVGRDAFALLMVVESLLRKHDHRKALKVAKDGRARYEEVGDKRGIAYALEVLLHAHCRTEAYDDALEDGDLAMDLIKETDDKRMEMNLLHLLSWVYVKKSEPDKAIQCLDDAGSLAQDLDDVEEEAVAKAAIASIHLDQRAQDVNELKRALAVSNEARSLFKRADIKSGEGSALLTAAFANYSQGNTEEALSLVEEAQELFQDEGFHKGEDEALRAISELNDGEERFSKAMKAAEERRALWEDLDNCGKEASALRMMAQIHLHSGEMAEAERVALESRTLSQKAGDKAGEVVSLLILTQVHLDALQKADPGEDLERPSPAFVKARDKANRAAGEACTLAGKSHDRNLRASAVLWRGQVLSYSRRHQDALRVAQEAEKLFKLTKDLVGQAHANIMVAYLHRAFSERDKAVEAANKALDLAREGKDVNVEAQALECLKKVEDKPEIVPQIQYVQPEGGETSAAPGAAPQPVAPTVVAPKGLDPDMVQVKITEMVKNVLTTDDEVENDSPFMEAGMDSLSSVQLVSEVSREFQMSLSPSLVFDFPTIRQLVDHLVEESSSM